MNVKNIPLKRRTFFYKDEELIFGEDLYIEFKNYKIPFSSQNIEEIKKQICGFLNSKGGRIYIGIDDKKIIKGIQLDYKKLDETRNNIINYTFEFFPKCRTNKIEVLFIPIKSGNTYIKNLYVIKIIIHQGDTNQLYSVIEKGGFISYMRLSGQCANLTAQEIRDEIIHRNQYPEKAINDNEFKDPLPENPNLTKNDFNINQLNTLINSLNLLNVYNNNNNNNNNNKNYYKGKKKRNQNRKNHNQHKFNNNNFVEENESEEDEFEDDENEEEEEFEEEDEEEEEENNYNKNKRGNVFRGRGGIPKNKRIKNNNAKKKYYVVKVSTYGVNPNIPTLQFIFNNLPNCKKKFLNKNGKIHGFLNFKNYEDAVKIVKEFTEHTPVYNGCGVKLTLKNNSLN